MRDGLDAEKSDNPDYVQQLESLYVYMTNRLMEANLQNDVEIMDEVTRLLITVKSGWDAIAAE
ncbi:Flagellar protein FliS [compost metagenome]